VNERLTQHGDVDATNIQVKVKGGEVTLDGTVTDRWQKRMAEDAVEDISGVKDVRNNLRVQQQNQNRQDNDQDQQGQNGQQGRQSQSEKNNRQTAKTTT